MPDVSLRSVVESAVKAEDVGAHFYNEYAKKFDNHPEVKRIFELLGEDEKDHKRQFNDLLHQVEDKVFAVKPEEIEFLEMVDMKHFFSDMENIDTNSFSPKQVLKMAFEFEKNAVLFFSMLRDILDDNKFLNEIVSIERGHMTKLMKYIATDGIEFRGIKDSWD